MNKMNLTKNSLVFALAAALTTLLPRLDAQVSGGTISGTVKDRSGAVVTGAQVTILNSRTGVIRTVTSNDSGLYRAPNLLPGAYQITSSVTGFQTLVRSDIELTVGAELVVDLELRPGSIAEKVEVTGEPLVDHNSASLTATVNGTTVRELPLNARDWTSLATLEPGVVVASTQPHLGIDVARPIRGLGTQMTIGGNRPQQNSFRLDGININDYANGAPGSILGTVAGVDAIQEFSVLTNNPPASYGRTSGGVVNAITRSGTDEWHGSAYEFYRNSVLDARNFFDPSKIPPFNRNQFGASSGGPVRRDRTFIFGDYEGVRERLTNTQLAVVPTLAARNGQLSTGQVVVDPKVKPYLALYPLPDGAVFGDAGIFTTTTQRDTRENFFTVRADHKLSSHDSLFATYMFDDGKTTAPDTFSTNLRALLSRRHAVILEATHIFSPQLTNSLRLGFSRTVSDAIKPLKAINPLAADISLGFVPGRPMGDIQVGGIDALFAGLGSSPEFDFHNNSFQGYDDAFLLRGSHAFKFGAAVERIQLNQLIMDEPNGEFSFSSFADFLTNTPSRFESSLSGPTSNGLRATVFGSYFQDDWRIASNLTVNLGLRYEMATVPTEAHGRLSNLNSPTDAQPRLGSPYFFNPTKRNFEPRVGFAWDPFRSGKTSVRGAFGIYDELPLPYVFAILHPAPFSKQAGIDNPPVGTFPTGAFGLLTPNRQRYAFIESHPPRSYVMHWNFNIQREVASDVTVLLAYVGSRGVHMPFHSNDINIVRPTLTPEGYVWPTPPGSGTIPNPNTGAINGVFWNSDSIYHAFWSQVTRRMHRGLQIGASYTWGKTIDTGSSSFITDVFDNSIRRLPFDPKSGRGLADFDVRHNFTLDYIWQIPGTAKASGLLGWAIHGWQLGGIYNVHGGTPFTTAIDGDPLGMNSSSVNFDFPDVLTGPGCKSLVNPGNPIHYIKTECFVFPNPSTRMGNAGRNILIGPGFSNVDMSLFKNNAVPKISDKFNIQFRVEVFNIFNHANFAPPLNNNSLFDATGNRIDSAGLIDSTANSSRQIQLAVKLAW